MFGFPIPTDLANLILAFCWNKDLTVKRVLEQLLFVEDVQDSVPSEFFSPLAWDSVLEQQIPNPYIESFPFHPLCHLDNQSLWGSCLWHLPSQLNRTFFRRNRTYRNVLRRHVHYLYINGFRYYNTILSKYLIHIGVQDFSPYTCTHTDKERIIRLLEECYPLASLDFEV